MTESETRVSPSLNGATVMPTNTGNSRGSGTRIGRYLVIEEVGRGGMGVVLRAYDPRLQREVALKSVRADELSGEARGRMLREAQAMAKLSHPNVVAVYDVEASDGEVVIAMEYVRGATLTRWLADGHSPHEVIAMFASAGRGLAVAHAAGLLHRDFKPANVLVGEDARPRVTDFGLARPHEVQTDTVTAATATAQWSGNVSSDLTELGTVLGTPGYMAPEQHEAGELGPAADQYAFCVALWEGLTGQRPFVGADLHAVAEAKRKGPPPWPRDVAVPAAVRDALRRGLAPVPEERWPTTDALMDALLAALAVADRPRRTRLMIASSTAAIAASAGLLGAAEQQRRADRCTGAAAQLEKVWNAARREQVHDALTTTGIPYVEQIWERVAPQLDEYTSTWAAVHKDTCEATTIRGEQSSAIMDLKMACLHRAKVELQAVTNLLAAADAQVVDQAHQLLGGLPELRRCTDVAALEAQVPPPGQNEREAVEAVRVALADVRALLMAGKYPAALERVKSVASRAEGVAYRPLRTEVMMELALALDESGFPAEAQAALERGLRTALASGQWQEAESIASSLIHLVGWAQLRPQEGLAYAETARGLSRPAGEVVNPDLPTNIGNILITLGRYPEAEAEHRRAVQLAEQRWGTDHVNVTPHLANLGATLRFAGKLAEAEEQQRRTVASTAASLGPDHPLVAHARFQLGETLFAQGKYADAEAEHRLALAAREKNLQPNDPSIAMSRQALANMLVTQGRTAEAEVEYRAALRVQLQALGAEHIFVAVTRLSLVNVLLHQGRFRDAESEARTGVAILQKTVGESHHYSPLAHSQLARALHSQGRHEEAETELRTGLKHARQSLGAEHPHVSRILNDLAKVLLAEQRYAEAELEQRNALRVQTNTLGPEHAEVVMSKSLLGDILRARGRHEDALVQYREALALQESLTGADHPRMAQLQAGLGRTLVESGDTRAALESLDDAWNTWKDDARVPAALRARLALELARALWASEQASGQASGQASDRERAIEIARAGLLRVDALLVDERSTLEAWLRAHS